MNVSLELLVTSHTLTSDTSSSHLILWWFELDFCGLLCIVFVGQNERQWNTALWEARDNRGVE